MGRSVSEAAARAVKNSERKTVETRNPKQVISDIRKNLAAKLFVPPDDQRFLLAQYDDVIRRATEEETVYQNEIADLKAQIASLVVLHSEIETFKTGYRKA